MKSLRRIVLAGTLAIAACGIASADSIIVYQVTMPASFTTTDLNNFAGSAPAWNPGATTNASNFASSVSGAANMASVASNAVLQWYSVSVTQTIQGTISVVNGNTN